VWSDGKVCSGNATLPEEDQRNDRDAWERFFFGSHFTHPNFSQKDRLTLGVEPCAFWQKQLNRPTKAFPESVLVDINLTVNDLLALDFYERPHVRALGEF
jgi:PRTRC genetic system protein B